MDLIMSEETSDSEVMVGDCIATVLPVYIIDPVASPIIIQEAVLLGFGLTTRHKI